MTVTIKTTEQLRKTPGVTEMDKDWFHGPSDSFTSLMVEELAGKTVTLVPQEGSFGWLGTIKPRGSTWNIYSWMVVEKEDLFDKLYTRMTE